MAYAFTLLAALGLFLWATPARNAIVERMPDVRSFGQEIASSSGDALRAQAGRIIHTAREKVLELIRKQIHNSVDDLVK